MKTLYQSFGASFYFHRYNFILNLYHEVNLGLAIPGFSVPVIQGCFFVNVNERL